MTASSSMVTGSVGSPGGSRDEEDADDRMCRLEAKVDAMKAMKDEMNVKLDMIMDGRWKPFYRLQLIRSLSWDHAAPRRKFSDDDD